MNRDETIALFECCEAARAEAKNAALAEGKSEREARTIAHSVAKAIWNGWADTLLAERDAMEQEGHWAAEQRHWGVELQNDETHDWLMRAAADFTCCHFQVRGDNEDERFAGGFGEAAEQSDPPGKTVRVESRGINFSGFKFPGDARFGDAFFSDRARFDGATITGDAYFGSCSFVGDTFFDSTTFSGRAWFDNASFSREAFFDNASFLSRVRFDSASFIGNAFFLNASFANDAFFDRAAFWGCVRFDSASFANDARFGIARIKGYARFNRAIITGDALFDNTTFTDNAWFMYTTFSGRAIFRDTLFRQAAYFSLTKFVQFAGFERTRFCNGADFYAIRAERGFSMADAYFEHVPDFIQAHFEEAPRLDHVAVRGQTIPSFPMLEKRRRGDGEEIEPTVCEITWYRLRQKATLPWRTLAGSWRRLRRGMAKKDDLHNIPARWRALKRLAIHAHDQERELEFFAREIRSTRFLHDWPLPLCRPGFSLPFLKWLNKIPFIFWYLRGWFQFARFWAGIIYMLTSNYGRSIVLPALWWFAGIAVAMMFYLGEQPGMPDQRALAQMRGESVIKSYISTAIDAWQKERPCYSPPRSSGDTTEVSGLSQELRAQTSAWQEAIQLALRNGFLILYGDADTAHRIHGCLYGVELYGGGDPVAIVPPNVAFWSAIHKLWSAVMIFLFGLALRSMLRVK